MFNKDVNEKQLINYLLELIFKTNALLEMINPQDNMKLLEMSVNKNDIMSKLHSVIDNTIVDKSKVVVIKLDRLFLVIPLTITKVEVKLRNVLINEKPKLDGLARFMNFYLSNFTSPLNKGNDQEQQQDQIPKKTANIPK